MGIISLAPQVRVSLDGRWLAWRSVTEAVGDWTVIPLSGGAGASRMTSRAVANWHALVAAAPLLSSWNIEVAHCIGDQPVEACPECMGLTMAINTVARAAQL